MTVTRAHLPNPIHSEMEQLDLHVGVVYRPERDSERLVAVMLQPRGAALSERKVGAVFGNWPAVMEVITGLVDQGTEAWGPIPSEARYEQMLLWFGEMAGSLTRSENRERLTRHLESGELKAAYVKLLRDQLSSVLRESGREAAPEEPQA